MKKSNPKSGSGCLSAGRCFRLQFILWIIFLLGCGAKGPLKLEPRKTPTVIKDIKILQLGNNLRLMWNFPDKLSDKKTRMEIKGIRKIRIYHADGLLTPKKFKKKSSLIMKLKDKELIKKDNYFYADLAFKTKNLDKKQHSFAIRYSYEKDKAPLSKIVTLETVIPTKAIEDLSIVKENKVIKLKWSRPKLNLNNAVIRYVTGYRVYRKIEKGDFSPLNRENVLEEYYEDTDTGRDGEYFYTVSSILSQEIESEPSNIVSVKVEDVFPPDPPSNLISFRADDHIFLTWHEITEKDLDFYRIFRKSSPDDEFKLLADKVKQNYFKDLTVQKGVLYIYAVTAIDKKGNESQISNITKETF
jgi:hypothetical protein